MRIEGYKRNLQAKINELNSLLDESIPDRLDNIYISSFVERNKDKEYSNTRLSKNQDFKRAYDFIKDMYYYDKFINLVPAMCFQRAGFPLPEKKLLYQNTNRMANGWFETESVVNNEILKSQICYRRTDSDQQFTEYGYGAIYYGKHETRWNAQPYVTLHELCHYAHHGIEKLSEIERKEYSFNKDVAKMVSEYAMEHYVEFIAESLAMLFFSGQFEPDFKENSLMYITKELPQADSSSHKAFIAPYNKLIMQGYKSAYDTDKTLVTPFNLTEKTLLDLAEKSNDFYPLSNRIETIMYCKANYFKDSDCRLIIDKLCCFVNDVYDIMPGCSLQKLELI